MAAYEDARSIAQTLIKEIPPPLTRDRIEAEVDKVLSIQPAWRAGIDRGALVKDLESIFSVWIGVARTLSDDTNHEEWLAKRRGAIEWRFWERYRTFLGQRLGQKALDSLEEVTDDVLKRLEWPGRPGGWDRRGLVVGHVQSGKTANYTGLICKAADAGYGVIVVLAGLHKSLRSQTQIRLDEGFLGYDSTPRPDGSRVPTGVGLVDPRVLADTVTNRSDDGDFRQAVAQRVAINPGGNPLLFVIKKNASVLRNLLSWVQFAAKTQDDTGRKIVTDASLLVIDDEADNASVDTKQRAIDEDGNLAEDHDPTRINKNIRQLLMSFQKRAYVGYTATPFANIFIHESGATPNEGEDLFPRSFIMNLPAPSNYVGPVRVFGLDADQSGGAVPAGLPLVRFIEDNASTADPRESRGWMPPKHDKSHRPLVDGVPAVPRSLHEALLSFVLACAARVERGQVNKHNSMLVHVTRFTDVQTLVFEQVKAELADLRNRIQRGEGAAPVTVLSELQHLWEKDFVPTTERIREQEPELRTITWERIALHLRDVVASIELRKINGTAADILDYEARRDGGLNVIAIGGDKLARGLTLEGLTVSYFLRASRMYDTLMQMGRWFGYRDGFVDLCRLFMPRELEEWFRRITAAGDELRREFDQMVAVGDVPINYGLRVRAHPGLLITAPVKMRHGTEVGISFAGDISETTIFHKDAENRQGNVTAVDTLIGSLAETPSVSPEQPRPEGRLDRWKGTHVWQGVVGTAVSAFLRVYRSHPKAEKVRGPLLADFIDAQLSAGKLNSWTVALLSKGTMDDDETEEDDNPPHTFGGKYQASVFTRKARRSDPSTHYIRRLVSPKDEAIDLGQEDYSAALAATRDAWTPDAGRSRRKEPPDIPSGPALRARRPPERGLLLIYPLAPKAAGITTDSLPLIGIAVSFPGDGEARTVLYRVNNVYWEQEYGEPA